MTIIPLLANLTLLLVTNAASWCPTKGPACYLPDEHLIIIDQTIKPEYVPFVFLHEYGHYLYGMDEHKANLFAEQFKVVIPKGIQAL